MTKSPANKVDDDSDWVHDDAIKNYEFWISWKRSQLMCERDAEGVKNEAGYRINR
jgi:hypothetical protein